MKHFRLAYLVLAVLSFAQAINWWAVNELHRSAFLAVLGTTLIVLSERCRVDTTTSR